MAHAYIQALADEPGPSDARPMLIEVMRDGRRLSRESLTTTRARVVAEREALPDHLRMLDVLVGPSPRVNDRLASLRADV
jgi:nicotinate phosphoribosyltransferase